MTSGSRQCHPRMLLVPAQYGSEKQRLRHCALSWLLGIPTARWAAQRFGLPEVSRFPKGHVPLLMLWRSRPSTWRRISPAIARAAQFTPTKASGECGPEQPSARNQHLAAGRVQSEAPPGLPPPSRSARRILLLMGVSDRVLDLDGKAGQMGVQR